MTTLAPPKSDHNWFAYFFGVENMTVAHLPSSDDTSPTSSRWFPGWIESRPLAANDDTVVSWEPTSANLVWLRLDELELIATLPMPENLPQFVQAYQQINWDKQNADVFARAANLALQVGAHLTARECALAGNQRYPHHPELQKMAQILAPPKARTVPGSGNRSWPANRAWLQRHWHEYRGYWVALHNGELLAFADDVTGLVTQVGELKGKDILITPIW